jgi:cytochrome c oxidase cbb3-type subunit III
MTSDPHKTPHEDPIRHHVYDGIAEYDRRLPNWWLVTFYATIVFSIVYWFVTQLSAHATDAARLEKSLAQLEAARLADAGAPRDDASLWKMSRNDVFVSAGRNAYLTTCASCHGPGLKGGVGPNLVDETWLHGGNPTQVLATVEKGVLAKGMPAWGPVLGSKRVNELVAFILSQHTPPASAAP